MKILSLRLSGCASSGPLRNRFSERTRRRKWGRVFGLWRRDGWTKEVSQTAVQCQERFGQVDGESWNCSHWRVLHISRMGLSWYFCCAPSLAEESLWGLWPWGNCSDGFRETGSEAVSQLCSHNKSPERAFSWLLQSNPHATQIYFFALVWGATSLGYLFLRGKLEEG